MKRLLVIFTAILIVLGMLLLWVSSNSERIIKTFDRTGEEIVLTVHVYNTQVELVNAINIRVGYEVDPDHLGLAIYSPDDNICEIFALEPKKVDGEKTRTLGHELLHCIYGEVHK